MSRPPLILREARASDRTVVIAVTGDLVLTNSNELEAAIESAFAAGRIRVVLDLAGITHVDTPGLALMVRLQERCEARGGGLAVAALPRSFDEIVDQLRLARRLRLVGSVEAALEPPER
ncbi:MAG TPA: STAS domain-containing protein [Gemmatimonadota bacterium]|nr:STAS domain-containing protein [Gemmatimonadota bacterium]